MLSPSVGELIRDIENWERHYPEVAKESEKNTQNSVGTVPVMVRSTSTVGHELLQEDCLVILTPMENWLILNIWIFNNFTFFICMFIYIL